MKKITKLFLFALVLFGLGIVKVNAATLRITFTNVNPLSPSTTNTASGTTGSKGKLLAQTTYTTGDDTYTFEGWYVGDTKLDPTYVDQEAGITLTVLEPAKIQYAYTGEEDTSITVRANWTKTTVAKLNMTFTNINPLSTDTTSSELGTSGTTSSLLSQTTYTQGDDTYTFEGWYVGNTKLNPTYSDDSKGITLTVVDQTKIQYAYTGEEDTSITVRANWTKTTVKKCNVTFWFREQDQDGNTVQSGNGIPYSYQTNSLTVGTGWTKFSRALAKTTFTNGGTVYEIDGWYDENGNRIPESRYYNGDPNRIYTETFNCTEDSPSEVIYTYYLKWNAYKAPIIKFDYINKVNNGNGTGSWTNTDGAVVDYTHTFKEPKGTSSYKFLYWKMDDGTTYGDGDSVTFSFADMNYGDEESYTALAWWQPGVKVNYYNEDKSDFKLGEWSFEDVQLISETPSKPGWRFIGWYDKDGNKVTKTTFEVPEITTEPNKEVTYNLYAKFEKIKTTVTVHKEWNDNDETHRPESIDFDVILGDETVSTVTLNSENGWETEVVLDRYDEEGNELEYTVVEKEVRYYTSEVSPATPNEETDATEDNEQTITVTNTIKDDGKVTVKHIEKESGEVIDTDEIIDVIDSDYETKPNSYDDYEYLDEYEGETSGTITEEEKTVIYYYKALIGKVIVYYIDIDTGETLATETFTGKYKTDWAADLTRTFEGYEYVDAEGDTEGVFGAEDIEVILYYTQNTGDEGEKEDDVITPPHTDVDIEFNVSTQQLYLDDRKYKKNKDFK